MLKIVLYPISLIFLLITNLRSWLYDRGLFPAYRPGLKTIVVGNLNVGGTGKTPFVGFIARHLRESGIHVALLSRGYKRKSKGFLEVAPNSKVYEVGDEPFYLYHRFKAEIPVFLDGNRVRAVKHITCKTGIDCLILDDGLQHRAFSGEVNLLLTTYQKPFYLDRPLPSGRLRESRKGAKRAHIIIVTKCPGSLREDEATLIKNNILRFTDSNTPVYFSALNYPNLKPDWKREGQSAVIVTGIAEAGPMIDYLNETITITHHFQYPDHHTYTKSDIEDICKLCRETQSVVITTDKDVVKIREFEDLMSGVDIYVQSIEVRILFDREKELLQKLAAN